MVHLVHTHHHNEDNHHISTTCQGVQMGYRRTGSVGSHVSSHSRTSQHSHRSRGGGTIYTGTNEFEDDQAARSKMKVD